jgi:hypothetical protein
MGAPKSTSIAARRGVAIRKETRRESKAGCSLYKLDFVLQINRAWIREGPRIDG